MADDQVNLDNTPILVKVPSLVARGFRMVNVANKALPSCKPLEEGNISSQYYYHPCHYYYYYYYIPLFVPPLFPPQLLLSIWDSAKHLLHFIFTTQQGIAYIFIHSFINPFIHSALHSMRPEFMTPRTRAACVLY